MKLCQRMIEVAAFVVAFAVLYTIFIVIPENLSHNMRMSYTLLVPLSFLVLIFVVAKVAINDTSYQNFYGWCIKVESKFPWLQGLWGITRRLIVLPCEIFIFSFFTGKIGKISRRMLEILAIISVIGGFCFIWFFTKDRMSYADASTITSVSCVLYLFWCGISLILFDRTITNPKLKWQNICPWAINLWSVTKILVFFPLYLFLCAVSSIVFQQKKQTSDSA